MLYRKTKLSMSFNIAKSLEKRLKRTVDNLSVDLSRRIWQGPTVRASAFLYSGSCCSLCGS